MKTYLSASAILLVAGCAVGPDFKRPESVGTNAVPATYSGAVPADWKPAEPSAHLPRGAWWEIFNDPALNHLEQLAATNNQQLAAALANFEESRAALGVTRAGYFPQLTAAPGMTRQRTSENSPSGGKASHKTYTYNTFTAPLDASWEIDLWGRVRRQVEGSRARMEASADDLESLKLSIQAEVASDYFTLRSLDAQHRLLEETVVTYQRSLELTQNRHKGGIASDLDVAEAETQLRATDAKIPAIDLERAQTLHALAVLCGTSASSFQVTVSTNEMLGVPDIPLSVPSQLLEHRPDIAAAERRMAAANADIGAAKGAFYPGVTLNGMAGFQSIGIDTLFNWESRAWSFGPSVSLPIFTGGKNRAQLASSKAAFDVTVADYRGTVLNAFADVENQLASQSLLEKQFDAENAALQSAKRTLDISLYRYKGGIITYLEVSTAQDAALAHEQTVVQLKAARLNAAVALIKALGAGWTPAESK